jgi:hypothetical protein
VRERDALQRATDAPPYSRRTVMLSRARHAFCVTLAGSSKRQMFIIHERKKWYHYGHRSATEFIV